VFVRSNTLVFTVHIIFSSLCYMHNFLPYLTYQSTFMVRGLLVWNNFALGDNLKRFSHQHSSTYLTMKICIVVLQTDRERENKIKWINFQVTFLNFYHFLFQAKIFLFHDDYLLQTFIWQAFSFYHVMQAYFRCKLVITAHFPHIFCLMISFLSWHLFTSLHGNISNFNIQSL